MIGLVHFAREYVRWKLGSEECGKTRYDKLHHPSSSFFFF